MPRIGFSAAVLLSIVITCIAHVLLGWQWTLLGGIVAGILAPSRASWAGVLTGVGAWGVLIAYNLIVAQERIATMLSTSGAIFGGVPGWVPVIASLAMGAILAFVGAMAGRVLRRVWLNFSGTPVVQSN